MDRLSIALVCLAAAHLSGCGSRTGTTTVQVWNTEYDFPTEHLRASRPGAPSPWVIVNSGQVSDPKSFVLEYGMREQDTTWPSGLPRVRWITFMNTNPSEIEVRRLGGEQVICQTGRIRLRYTCGISFVERGARWSVRFGDERRQDPESVLAEAVELLRQSQRSPRP